MTRSRNAFALTSVLAALAAIAGACDPGNEPTTVNGGPFAPQSSVFGKAHYFHSGLFVDDSYDVTWIVQSEAPDLCAHFERYASCLPDGGGVDPFAPRNPEGLRLELSFNSFADSKNSIEDGTGGIDLRFAEERDGGVVFENVAVKGTISGQGHVGDDHIFGKYQVTLDGGDEVSGSWSADHCESMDEILEWELYGRDRCDG